MLTVEEVLAQLNPKLRKNIMSGDSVPATEYAATPSFGLNRALNGGFPYGRQVLVWGNKSSGKSSFCLQLIAEAQKEGKVCAWIDAEMTFSPEWATELGRYKTKQPVYISRDDNKLLAFAGIYDRWISPDGEIRDSVAIITRDAVGQLAKVHSRMPVCMPKNRWDDWLDSKLNDANQLRSLMELKEPDAKLRFWPVSNRVNSIRNNGAELIAPEEIGPAETLF